MANRLHLNGNQTYIIDNSSHFPGKIRKSICRSVFCDQFHTYKLSNILSFRPLILPPEIFFRILLFNTDRSTQIHNEFTNQTPDKDSREFLDTLRYARIVTVHRTRRCVGFHRNYENWDKIIIDLTIFIRNHIIVIVTNSKTF